MAKYKTLYLVPTTAVAIVASPAPSGDLPVGDVDAIAIDITVSAITGTGAGYSFIIERKGLDGLYYPIYTSASITATGVTSVNLGVGAPTNVLFGEKIRIKETVIGTTPSVTRSVSVQGKLRNDAQVF